MIRLYLNQGFDVKGLVPDLDSIKTYLQSVGVPFESAVFDTLPNLKKANLENSFIRCDLKFGAEHVTQLSMAPENVRFSGTFDALSFENGSWLPRLKYFDILRRRIVAHFGNLEIKESAAILCDSSVCEGLVSVLVSLGYRTILLFSPDDAEDRAFALSRYFIGINFKTIPYSILTQNQNTTSMIVNAVDLEGNSGLMSDLAYFNFMVPEGIVVDLFSKTPVHPLLFEAEKAGLRTMKRRDITAFYDYESLRSIYIQAESTKDEFLHNYVEIETIDQ